MALEIGGSRPALGITSPTWTVASLLNSWAHYESGYGKAEYCKSADGRVQLRGLVKHLAASSPIILTLPIGFRPVTAIPIFLCMGVVAGSTVSGWRVDVGTEGSLSPSVGAANTEYLSLSGISFYAN